MAMQGTTSSPRPREIPSRRIILNNLDQLPGDYSTTPGGTLFSTTPGGTRIVYDRSFLLECRNSPLTKSPPIMAKIPGITEPGPVEVSKENSPKIPEEKEKSALLLSDHPEEQPQFEMDI